MATQDQILEDEINNMGDEPILEDEEMEEPELEEEGNKGEIIVAVEGVLDNAGPDMGREEKIDMVIAELESMKGGVEEEGETELGGLGDNEGLSLDEMEEV